VLLFAILLLATVYQSSQSNDDYYQAGESDILKVKKGAVFSIRLYENGSTGYVNCVLNENKFKRIRRAHSSYKQSIHSKLGYTGSGGVTTIYFEALETGTDTIRINACPLGPQGKDCSDFTDENTKAGNEFIIIISSD